MKLRMDKARRATQNHNPLLVSWPQPSIIIHPLTEENIHSIRKNHITSGQVSMVVIPKSVPKGMYSHFTGESTVDTEHKFTLIPGELEDPKGDIQGRIHFFLLVV